MFVSQAHSFTQQARLAVTLAWVAGYTNVLTILTCGTPTSHVSGTLSQWGRHLAEGEWGLAGFMAFLLASFISGAILSGFCTETGRRRGWESVYVLPITLLAVLLTVAAILMELHDETEDMSGASLYAFAGLASLAMGLQNATITRISGGVVRTTHMTGVFTDLGLEGAQLLYWLRDRRQDSPPLSPRALFRSARTHPPARRLALLGSIAGSFALGAGLGAAGHRELGSLEMLPPVLFLLWIILQDVRTPICEIEPSSLVGGDTGIDLPGGLAVYHLRKDRDRRGRLHRFPDLLRWFDNLPPQNRVVVLDLGVSARFDDNAALELRALMQRARAMDRELVLSGMDGAQYRGMLRAGAGDVLDPTNVCPDLELSIARGFMLLEQRATHPRAEDSRRQSRQA